MTGIKLLKKERDNKEIVTLWGYTAQNGEIPVEIKNGKGYFLYQVGGEVTDNREGKEKEYNPYYRYGKKPSEEFQKSSRERASTILQEIKDKTGQEIKSQQDIVNLLNKKLIKPYEAQIALQTLAERRFRELEPRLKYILEEASKNGKLKDKEVFIDRDADIRFEIEPVEGEEGKYKVNYLRDSLNEELKKRKGWEKLDSSLLYNVGGIKLGNSQVGKDSRRKPIDKPKSDTKPETEKRSYLVFKGETTGEASRVTQDTTKARVDNSLSSREERTSDTLGTKERDFMNMFSSLNPNEREEFMGIFTKSLKEYIEKKQKENSSSERGKERTETDLAYKGETPSSPRDAFDVPYGPYGQYGIPYS